MKLSDYVMSFLSSFTDSVFLLSGGGIMHLVDSLGRSKLHAYCCHHEQACAIAAEGYARIKNKPGVVLVTTGPGGTNAITGVAGAWLDSIPMMVIAGQVRKPLISPRIGGKPVLRQLGLQELNVIDLVKPITKYAVTVNDKKTIRYHLEKALYLSQAGRPGPVWLEIPLDIQASDINPDNLKSFNKPEKPQYKIPMDRIVIELKKAKKPLLLVGNGIRLGGAVDMLGKVLDKFKFNTVTHLLTGDDLVSKDYPFFLGRQGVTGNYEANYAVDNCDLLLAIGERIQLTSTSFEYENYLKETTVVMVDIDKNELIKKTLHVDIPVECDAKIFLEELYKQNFTLAKWSVPSSPLKLDREVDGNKYVDVYKFMQRLSAVSKGFPVATANGLAAVATHQAFFGFLGQRLFTNAGLGHMGAGFPLAIGASIACGQKPVICIEGDGSLMLNIQELQTMIYHHLPIKLFILSNDGYLSIRNTHLNYFKKIFAADKSSGVSFPDFSKLIKGWGIDYAKIACLKDLDNLEKIINHEGSIVCEVMIDPYQPLLSKWSAGQYRIKH